MFFIDDPEYTKHGYYLVDGTKTFSKFEAWQLSGHDIDKIQFIFNDDVFGAIDTTKEPEEDIYELYRQRAEQLRKDYDYIVLIYSGGIDSHTVLETFLDNNLKIDEICTFSNNDVQGKTEKFNQEIYGAAVPFVETLDLKKLGTKFRLVNIGQMVIDQLSDTHHFENFQHYSLSTPFWRTAVSNQVLKANIAEHRKIVESGKTVCYVWGHEKPTLRVSDQKYCLTIPDTFSGSFGAKQYNNRQLLKNSFDNFYDEAFYICRESPKISIKQGHMLANLMLSLTSDSPVIKKFWEIPIFGPYVQYKDLGVQTDWLSKPAVDKCIYPRAIMSRFGDDKLYTGSTIYSKKDDWFALSSHENSIKFNQKMKQLITNNTGLYKFRRRDLRDPSAGNFAFSTSIICSQFYPLVNIPEKPETT
jgi:hypothetical protein